MNKIRLYIPPVILGFVIVPLLVWPTVVALAAFSITLSFLGKYCSQSRSLSGVFHFWNYNFGYRLNMRLFSVQWWAWVGNLLAERHRN